MEALERLMKGRTVIMIAHRLSTIRDANQIIVLKDGVVAESGTHERLLSLGGVYAELYQKQFEPEHRRALELQPRSHMSRSLIVLPDETAKPILDAIDGAKESLRIKMFVFSDPAIAEGGDRRARTRGEGPADAEPGAPQRRGGERGNPKATD